MTYLFMVDCGEVSRHELTTQIGKIEFFAGFLYIDYIDGNLDIPSIL